ncbi:MAG TPA: glycosyltransferase [Anaerolineae bacterium]|nr:glycosyltransferase [Anaerolineae bacterium]
MRVGIYDRWLYTLGGGERHMLALAQHLSIDHVVEILTHQAVDLNSAGRKLNIDTRGLRLRCVPEMPDPALSLITQQYDLFIQASQASFIPSQARRSLMLVFFPTPIHLSRSARLRRSVGLWLRRQLMQPIYQRGFYSAEYTEGRFVRWTDGHAIVLVPIGSGRVKLSMLIDARGANSKVPVTLRLNDRVIDQLEVSESDRALPVQVDLQAGIGGLAVLEVVSPTRTEWLSPGSSRSIGVAISDLQIQHWRARLYSLLFDRLFKELGLRLLSIPDQVDADTLDSYSILCANSEFTREWIQRYWGRDSQIFHPPVDVAAFQPADKRNIILTVGRIFAGSHNKKHLPMIETFKRMTRSGLSGWEFHIVGSVPPEAVHQDYLKRIRSAAQGFPIYVHTDLPFDQLQELYGAARIYWHASGYGEDEQRDPIKFEHFGITTVEAMAAGAVPVVIGKAGQLEVVEHDRNGLHWQTLDELIGYTQQLITDKSMWQRLSDGARERSRSFGRAAFDRRVKELLVELEV